MGLAKIIITLFGSKFRKALRDAEKITNESPGLKNEIGQFATESEKLKQDMEKFCKDYPDDPLCNGKNYGRSFESEKW